MSKEKALAVSSENLQATALEIQTQAEQRAVALKELGVESKDLVIPSIQVMQSTSALVNDGKAKLGELVNMQTEQVLGGEKPVAFLPLKLFKTLRVYDVSDGHKFVREEPLTEQNEKLSYEALEDIDGRSTPVKRYHTFNFFVLLKSDLEKGEGFPCLVRFKSTGMNAGRTLATHLFKRVYLNKKPYSVFVELSTRKDKKGTNTYGVPVVTAGKAEPASPGQMQECEGWLAMLAAGNYKIDDREDLPEEAVGTAAAPVVMAAEVMGSPNGAY